MNSHITENIRGFDFVLETKPGVFSKNGIDAGTKLLIDTMIIQDETLIADLGSGTGIVGFVVAKLNPRGHVHLLEDHLRTFELAKENAENNRLRNVEVFLSDLFSAVRDRTYHQIYSNPPQQLGNEFLEELIESCYTHLKPKGELFVVVKNNVSPFMERTIKTNFKNVKIEAKGKEHVVIKGIK